MKNLELLTQPEVEELTRRSRSSLYRYRKRQNTDFPAPLEIGNGLFWKKDEILNWLENQRKQ